MTTRRNLLKCIAATLAAGPFAAGARAAGAGIDRKPIPASGELLPVVGMGTSRTFDAGGDAAARAPLAEVLAAFFEAGGTLIDSSPMYGNAERVVGDLLAGTAGRENLFAATKVWTDGRDAGVRQMRESMARMRVERFDLMQIHNLRDWGTHLETLREWKAEGRIRYVGITTSHGRDHAELERILGHEPFDFVQLSYSIGNRDVEARLLPIARERGLAVIVNRPFERGALFRRSRGKALPAWAGELGCASWAQFFLKFAVSHPEVTCAIPATSKVRHMRDNMGANTGRLPDTAERRRMLAAFEAL